jgi:hypothetical protein
MLENFLGWFALIGFAFFLAGLGVTVWLARRFWLRREELPRALLAIVAIVVALGASALLGIVLGVVKAFGAVGGESIDPSQKARILGEGIAAAMNWTAFGILVWIPSAIALFFLTRKRKVRSE